MTEIQQSNPAQQQAIDFLKGPSLIIAGAGTGKTYVLTEKIKKIVLEKKVNPENILALTFTEKAAYEMEERVDRALPYGFFQTWIMTFHSFADTILREFGMHIGLSPSYRLLSEAESVMFFRRNLRAFQINYFYSTGNPTGFIDSVLEHISRLKDENISPEDYQNYAEKLNKGAKTDEEKLEAEKSAELAHIYHTYQDLKLKFNYLDFSDLLYYLVKLIKTRPNILAELQRRFKYCLVDEFQDTNIVQYDLIKLLFPAEKKPQLTLIGDDNQSIYKFRGASISNILNFREDYQTAEVYVLTENYRSYQPILDSSYRLIKFNDPDTLEVRLGINKKLVAARGNGESEPQLLHGVDGDHEAELIVEEIKKWLDKPYKLNDFAVLVRANDHATPVLQALERHGIPYQFLGPALLYYKNEIRDLIALLKFLTDSHDSASLFRVLSMSLFSLQREHLIALLSFGKRISRSLIEVLYLLRDQTEGIVNEELDKVKDYLPYLPDKDKKKLVQITALLTDLLQSSPRKSALVVLYSFLDTSGYLKELSNIKSAEEEERLNNITRFFNRLKKMTGEYGEVSVREALENINLALELGDSPRVEDFAYEKENAVNILTTHSAKGLEFPVVFLTNLVADRFPTRNRSEKLPIPEALIKEKLPEGNYHLEEERRLFYVGMTRAKDRLYLSYADLYPGGKRQRKLSSFVIEALGQEKVEPLLTVPQGNKQLSIFTVLEKNKEQKPARKREPYRLEKASYTQVETYDRCPKQYEFRYVIRVPEPESPALSFGSSVHRALECFYKDLKEKRPATQDTLLDHFKNSFIPLGHYSRALQERSFQSGMKILTRYYEMYFDPKTEVVGLEQNFVLKLEHLGQKYTLGGKIDRVDRIGDIYEIIDYKTGKKPEDRVLKKSLQLGIYALAAMDRQLFNLKQEQIRLTYYYLDKGEKFSLMAKDRDLAEVKEQVITALDNIRSGSFEPIKGFQCEWCPFKIICPAWGN